MFEMMIFENGSLELFFNLVTQSKGVKREGLLVFLEAVKPSLLGRASTVERMEK